MNGAFWLSYLLLWCLVVLESLLIFALLREIGHIHLRSSQTIARDGLPIGSVLPKMAVRTRHDREVVLDSVLRRPYTVVISAVPECSFCVRAVETALRWIAANADLGATVVLNASEVGNYAEVPKQIDVVLARESDVLQLLRVRAAPFVHVVDRDARILAKGIVHDDRHFEQLLSLANVPARVPGLGVETADGAMHHHHRQLVGVGD